MRKCIVRVSFVFQDHVNFNIGKELNAFVKVCCLTLMAENEGPYCMTEFAGLIFSVENFEQTLLGVFLKLH